MIFLRNFLLFILLSATAAFAFKSKISDGEVPYAEHLKHKGHAASAMDELNILINHQKEYLLSGADQPYFQKKPGVLTAADMTEIGKFNAQKLAEARKLSKAIAELVFTGVLRWDDGIIDYGISDQQATQDEQRLISQGLSYFARFSKASVDDLAGRGDRLSTGHGSVAKDIVDLGRVAAIDPSIEMAMWMPSNYWEAKADGQSAAGNSHDAQGGGFRAAVMEQTFKCITNGYVSEDGWIILPHSDAGSLQERLRKSLVNVQVVDLDPRKSGIPSTYYPLGIPAVKGMKARKTVFRVTRGDTVMVALEMRNRPTTKDKDKIAVLNMANATSPGGGATGGSRAQEEQLCYRSILLAILYRHRAQEKAYDIEPHRHGLNTDPEYTDREPDCDSGIFSPNVSFFRAPVNTPGLPHYARSAQIHNFAVITSAAVDFRHMGKPEKGAPEFAVYEKTTKDRIRFQLRSALINGYYNIVLSAFGCGAFENDPAVVAQFYHDVLNEKEFQNQFEEVEFGIMVNTPVDQNNLDAFTAKFIPTV